MYAIEVSRLTKKYKNGVAALDNLNIKVKSGEIFSLLGPNGAGKSSLINILNTRYRPTSGEVFVLGKNICSESSFVRRHIACTSQNVTIDEHLSLMDNMLFQSRLYKVEKSAAKERIDSLIQSFDLSGYLKYPVASYSGGIKRRLDIAMNMVSRPEILFLDEPTVGMDIISRKAMWMIVRKIRDDFGTTVFLTTHYLEEADELSDTICIMKDGHEIVQESPLSLRNIIKQNMIRIGFCDSLEASKYNEELKKSGIVSSAYIRGNSLLLNADKKHNTFKSVDRWLLEREAPFNAIEIIEPSMEDIFLKLTEGGEQYGLH